MSIILKALKKAEETKSETQTPEKKTHSYQIENKKALRIIIIGFTGMVVVFSAAIYFFRPAPKVKTLVVTANKSAEVQKQEVQKTDVQKGAETEPAKKVPVVASLPAANAFHEDALKELKAKNYSSAEAILRKIIAISPDDAVAHNNLGLVLKNQGRHSEALSEYQKALKNNPEYVEAMNNLAVAYELMGNKGKAKPLYNKALSIKPSYAEAHLNYALLLEAEGNNTDAESHYHTFLNLSPDAALKAKVKERLRGLGK